jgi:hypothetical protein
MTKHNEHEDDILINDNQNVNIDKSNVNNNKLNVNIDKSNVNSDKLNVNNDNKCSKCNKILSSKQNLNKHLLICKGVSNPLECHLCHKIFSHRTSKWKHLKTCINKDITTTSVNELIETNNNNNKNEIITLNNIITNNNSNNIINNNSNNTITNYNIHLVSYNKEDRTINFDINHLNKDLIYKLRTMHENDAFDHFCYKLFQNKNNQMVVKTNLRHIYSNVHLGFNIWEKMIDNNIYHIIIYYISETMNKYIYENTTIEEREDNNISELLFYIKMMSSKMKMDKYPRKYENYYKNNIESLKLKFSEFIKDDDIDI